MSHPLLALVSVDLLEHDFDWGAIQRGMTYAARGAVLSVNTTQATSRSVKVIGQVQGSGRRNYSVLVDLDACADCGVDIASYCTCPVGSQCKHAVAAILALTDQRDVAPVAVDVAPSTWERTLSELLEELEPAVPGAAKQLAIQFALRAPPTYYGRSAQPRVAMRLVHQGARDNWIKTGIKWSDAPLLDRRRTYEPHQVDVVRSLHGEWQTPRYSYSTSIEEPGLGEFGPRLWTLLAAARDAGIALLAGDGLDALTVLDTPLDVAADTVEHDGSTLVRLGIEHDGRLWSGSELLTVGDPAHGVALLDGEAPGHLMTLGGLTRPASAGASRLLVSTEPLRVPAAERERLVESYLPRLARHVSAISSDGSVTVPPPLAPTLLVSVEWDSASTAEVTWEWRYGTRTTRIDSGDRLDGQRDHAAERALLTRLPVPPSAAFGKVTGADALELAVHLLPALRAVEGVEVVETERPEFREAVGGVAIAFESAAPAEGEEAHALDWLDLMVAIEVEGEKVLLPAVLEALTLGREHLVLPSGLYIATDRPEFAALEDLVKAASELSEAESDRVRVGTHDLGLWAQLSDLGVVDRQAATWVARARSLRDLTELPTPEPVGIVSTLRGYQREGFHWLAFLWQHELGGILADDMGLGKTLQVLALAAHARAAGAAPFLVVAPSSVVSAWQSEAARHAPGLRVQAITSSAARRGRLTVAELADGADLVVTTYTLLRLEQEQYAATQWGGLVLDEAQHVKNHQGKTYHAIRRLEAPFRLAVTGTPSRTA